MEYISIKELVLAMKKKVFALILALTMIASIVPVSAANNGETENLQAEPGVTALSEGTIYTIGPGKEYASISAFTSAVGFGNRLAPGDVVEIYPNIVDGKNVAYRQAELNISQNGTVDNPIIVRGMPGGGFEKPILSIAAANQYCIFRINGDYVHIENLVVDGGIYDAIDYINGQTVAGNLHGQRTTGVSLVGQTVTLANFQNFLNTANTRQTSILNSTSTANRFVIRR